MTDVRNPQQFYHGSDYPFEEGEEVLSPADNPYYQRLSGQYSDWATDARWNSVYMTPHRHRARLWGAHVYEVAPIGDVVPDEAREEFRDPDAVRASKARVIRKV